MGKLLLPWSFDGNSDVVNQVKKVFWCFLTDLDFLVHGRALTLKGSLRGFVSSGRWFGCHEKAAATLKLTSVAPVLRWHTVVLESKLLLLPSFRVERIHFVNTWNQIYMAARMDNGHENRAFFINIPNYFGRFWRMGQINCGVFGCVSSWTMPEVICKHHCHYQNFSPLANGLYLTVITNKPLCVMEIVTLRTPSPRWE